RLDELPLDRFLGPAVAVDVRGLPPRTSIGPERLRGPYPPGTIVLIVIGWSAYWGTARYHDHPYLTEAAARLLVESGVRTVGVDALSVDPTPAEDLPAHRVLCGAHAVIVENLTGLDAVLDAQAAGRPVEVSALPIRLTGADGAPVRAVARIANA
ncbi:MAG: cyclase family protein, partial [Streptosporangiales bacterium]|nr:cyclase family protein [Streptosporangiales bacterium]